MHGHRMTLLNKHYSISDIFEDSNDQDLMPVESLIVLKTSKRISYLFLFFAVLDGKKHGRDLSLMARHVADSE